MLLGDLLVRKGVLDADRLAAALDQQTGQDQKLGRILLANGCIASEDLTAALSRQSGLPQVDLTECWIHISSATPRLTANASMGVR